MSTFKRGFLFVTLVLLVSIILGCSLLTGGQTTAPALPEPVWLFYDDFAGEVVGEPPSGWTVEVSEGVIEVVEAPALESGKAVRILADPKSGETRITGSFVDVPGIEDVNTIAIEHKVYWIAGRGINVYVLKQGANLSWGILSGRRLAVRDGGSDQVVGTLVENAWNTIRIVASREHNKFYVYLNDTDTPYGPYSFRTTLQSSWNGAKIQVQHTSVAGDDVKGEALYGDFKIWAVDDVEFPAPPES